jgi:hypothetical protein
VAVVNPDLSIPLELPPEDPVLVMADQMASGEPAQSQDEPGPSDKGAPELDSVDLDPNEIAGLLEIAFGMIADRTGRASWLLKEGESLRLATPLAKVLDKYFPDSGLDSCEAQFGLALVGVLHPRLSQGEPGDDAEEVESTVVDHG